MKLVMTLLVRDEEDIVEDHLVYHLNQGVDFVIATDNNSVDGTRDVLEHFRRMGCLTVIDEPDDTYDQWRWVTRMARQAAVEHRADWVINSDADEFWWPKVGDLRSVLAAVPRAVGVVHAPRLNLVPPVEGEGRWYERMTLRETVSRNSLGAALPPKVCHRADPDVVVEQGNHELRVSSLTADAGLHPIVIFHAPIRSWPQFENKVAKGGAAYARNAELDPSMGDAWRALYRLRSEGRLRAFFETQVPDTDGRRRGIDEGRFVLDRRLAHFFATRARREPPFAEPSAPAVLVDHAIVTGGGADTAATDRPGPTARAHARPSVWRRGLGRIRRIASSR
jgi:hypothetical protein